jgi:hypothetical protein
LARTINEAALEQVDCRRLLRNRRVGAPGRA